MRKKPSRRLGQSCHDDKNDEGEDNLEGDGEAPGKVGGTVAAAVIDPVSDERANSNIATFNADDLASVVSLRTFGLVRRNGRCVDTVSDLFSESVPKSKKCLVCKTYTCDETPNDELCCAS